MLALKMGPATWNHHGHGHGLLNMLGQHHLGSNARSYAKQPRAVSISPSTFPAANVTSPVQFMARLTAVQTFLAWNSVVQTLTRPVNTVGYKIKVTLTNLNKNKQVGSLSVSLSSVSVSPCLLSLSLSMSSDSVSVSVYVFLKVNKLVLFLSLSLSNTLSLSHSLSLSIPPSLSLSLCLSVSLSLTLSLSLTHTILSLLSPSCQYFTFNISSSQNQLASTVQYNTYSSTNISGVKFCRAYFNQTSQYCWLKDQGENRD